MISRDLARETYRAHQMRVTPQRLAVVDELEGDTTHPTADEVAKRVKQRMQGISLSTIYKTLNELVDLGLIKRVEGVGSENAATHFDPNTDMHGHLHCRKCGHIVDIEIDDRYHDGIKGLEKKYKVEVENLQVEMTGVCWACK